MRQLLASGIFMVLSFVLLTTFILICISGSVIIYEDILIIRYFETFILAPCVVILAIERFIYAIRHQERRSKSSMIKTSSDTSDCLLSTYNHKGQPCIIDPSIFCQEGYCSECCISKAHSIDSSPSINNKEELDIG